MKYRSILKKIIEITGYTVIKTDTPDIGNRIPSGIVGTLYDQDGLRTIHNHEFMRDPSFINAYERGVKAQGSMKHLDSSDEPDYHWHWRIYIALWVASSASRLEGDFIECGVNKGFLSSSIMQYLDWNSLGKSFYLLDTFKGIDLSQITDEEKKMGLVEKK